MTADRQTRRYPRWPVAIECEVEGAFQDLALDLQLGPDPLHPKVWAALQEMARACEAAGVPFCANPRTPEHQQH